jgi:hypothetical protein
MNNYVNDLGVAAFVMMHGFKIIKKMGNTLYFEVAPGDVEEFERLQMEYLNSDFHRFDSFLMAIKKITSKSPLKD